jgi:hypothetical protein
LRRTQREVVLRDGTPLPCGVRIGNPQLAGWRALASTGRTARPARLTGFATIGCERLMMMMMISVQ